MLCPRSRLQAIYSRLLKIRVSAATVSDRVFFSNSLKKKILGAKYWRGFIPPNKKIQSQEHSRGSGADDALHNLAGRRWQRQHGLLQLGQQALEAQLQLVRQQLQPQRPFRSAQRLSSGSYLGRSFFCEMSLPAAQHFTNLDKRVRNTDVFFVIENFQFPGHLQKEFQGVEFNAGLLGNRQLVVSGRKSSGKD